ncbi:MAG: Rieske (2Fe-2S) protein [Cyanosarcina radialis HA8281-LM2]|jgi:nitrite reductase/ring-hydroxylating ferredoxin subunit|nr:Rieske (2Fe-2S) protein [Cyanosarcina radialis HA8281-LM2]
MNDERSTTNAPLPFPSGWFRIAYSDELLPGQVRALHYFDRDFVLFRTATSKLHLFDAHCPHLGAHLGYGGKVNDETIQCPFHGWRFNGEGQCVEIPYACKVLPKVQIQSWQVREVNGTILMYYHPDRKPPDWEIPLLPEYTCKDWIPFKRRRWQVRTNPQEIAENGVDTAHSPFLHRQTFVSLKSQSIEIDGAILVHQLLPIYNLSFAAGLLGKENLGSLEISYYGLGCQVSRACIETVIELDFLAIFMLTPIEEKLLEIDLIFSMRKIFSKTLTKLFAPKILMQKIGRDLEQDISIWENKIYCDRPTLCESEGAIMKYRRWSQQFY